MTTARSLPVAFMLALSFFACADKTTNNYTTLPPREGHVMGRVVPGENGTEVSLWQAELVASTTTDAEGYFVLGAMPSGLYSLRILAPSGAHRVWPNLQVDENEDLSLGAVETSSLPAPLYSISPEGVDISLGSSPNLDRIEIFSERTLDLKSLAEAIRIEPPLPGEWTEQSSGGQYDQPSRYAFLRSSAYKASTEYSITIGPGLRTLDGIAWGRTYVHHFTAEPFRVIDVDWFPNNGRSHVISSTYSGRLVGLTFNAALDTQSISAGITIQPPVDLVLSYQGYPFVSVEAIGKLTAGTDYLLMIGPPLSELYGAELNSVMTVAFETEPFGLVARHIVEYPTGVPVTGSDREIFSDVYNVTLDQGSARAAVSIDPECDFRVEGIADQRGFAVFLGGTLRPSIDYTVTIAPTLATTGGARIGSTQTVSFRTEALSLYRLEISDQSSGDSIDPLSPGGPLFIRAVFNLAVNLEVFARSTSIVPAIAGVWYADHSFDPPEVRFLTTDPTPLEPNQEYTLRVLGSAPLVDGATLGTDVVRTFHSSPVLVDQYHPRDGEAGVSRRTDIFIRFNMAMDTRACEGAFRLSEAAGESVFGVFTWENGNRQVRFQPSFALQPERMYEAVLSNEARDEEGHPLGAALTTRFRTGS